MKLTQVLVSFGLVVTAIAAPVVIEAGLNPEAYGLESTSDGYGGKYVNMDQAHAASQVGAKNAVGEQQQQGQTAQQAASVGQMQDVNAGAAKNAWSLAGKSDNANGAVEVANDRRAIIKPAMMGSTNEYDAKHENVMDQHVAPKSAQNNQHTNAAEQAEGMSQTGSLAVAGVIESALLKRRLCSMHELGSLAYIACVQNTGSATEHKTINQAAAMHKTQAMKHIDAMSQANPASQGQAAKHANQQNDKNNIQQVKTMDESQAVEKDDAVDQMHGEMGAKGKQQADQMGSTVIARPHEAQ